MNYIIVEREIKSKAKFKPALLTANKSCSGLLVTADCLAPVVNDNVASNSSSIMQSYTIEFLWTSTAVTRYLSIDCAVSFEQKWRR